MILRAALVIRAPMLLVCALAVALAGCGAPPTPSPTSRPTVPPQATGTPLPFLPDLNADDQKEVQTDTLNATCCDGDGTSELIWTCSSRDEVAVSVYGPSPPRVAAIRVVTTARREVDRRSWVRGYASLIGVEQLQWAEDHFGSNEGAKVGDVWVQMTHDSESDGVLISTKDLGLPTT